MNWISVNGKRQLADAPALLVSNRGYRYGDGLFETMKLIEGKIQLQSYHFERLFAGMQQLKMIAPSFFSEINIEKEIADLCEENNCRSLARVRLSVYRGHGGLYDDNKAIEYVIECWPLEPSMNQFNENGLVIGVCPGVQKTCDEYSHLKSSSAQCYSIAALYAREQKWNDAILLNSKGNVADTTIANILIYKKGTIRTPSRDQGCVAGVMRRFLLEKLGDMGFGIREDIITINDLEGAEEICLTNAIRGMRWVKQFNDRSYTCKTFAEIYRQLN